MIARALAALALLAASPTQAEGQWTTEYSDDTPFAHTVSASRLLHLGVGCADGGQVVMLSMLGDGIFHDGNVVAYWDDGTFDSYTFSDQNTVLMASAVSRSLGAGYNPGIAGLIAKIRERGSVRIAVRKWRDEPLSDSVPLGGSSRAIDSLPCS